MSGLRAKLNSLGTETGVMEAVLAEVKSALTRHQFRAPQDLRNLAVAQEATPVQRWDLQAVDRQTARPHWRQSHHEERLELGNHSDRLLLHTVVQGVGPEEPGPTWA